MAPPITIAALGISVACYTQARRSTFPLPAITSAAPVCYHLHVGPWLIPTDIQSPEQRFVPPTPDVLILDTAAAHGLVSAGPPFRAAHGVAHDPAWAPYELSHPGMWARRADTLHVVIGELGWQLIAREHSDSLSGRADVVTDMSGPQFPTAPVTGIRAPCPGR